MSCHKYFRLSMVSVSTFSSIDDTLSLTKYCHHLYLTELPPLNSLSKLLPLLGVCCPSTYSKKKSDIVFSEMIRLDGVLIWSENSVCFL